MKGGPLIREARKRAGLTQRELAERSLTSQSAIARYESGASEPTFERLTELIEACGLELMVRLGKGDDGHDLGLALLNLRLTPEQRIEQLEGLIDFVIKGRAAIAKRDRRTRSA